MRKGNGFFDRRNLLLPRRQFLQFGRVLPFSLRPILSCLNTASLCSKFGLANRFFQIYAAVPTEPFDQALDSFDHRKGMFALAGSSRFALGLLAERKVAGAVNRIIGTAESIVR